MFSFKDNLFTDDELMAKRPVMPEQSISNIYISSIRHITALYTDTTDSNSALCQGAILNSKGTHKKHQNVKNMALTGL